MPKNHSKIYFFVIILIIFINNFTYLHAQISDNQNIEKRKEKTPDLKSNDTKEEAPIAGDTLKLSGADEGEYIKMSDSGEGIVVLRGNIKMEHDGKRIFAGKVVYNRKTGDVTLLENVRLEDGENIIRASKIIYNVKDRAGVLYKIESDKKPVILKGEKIKIVDKKYIGEKIDFTTCDLERPHYHFRVEKVWIYSNKRIVAYNAVYVIGDIPLFYFPAVVHTDEGIGIITQLGHSLRRGNFMQNTLRYTSEDKSKWKYKLDIYEKMGYYGGFEFSKKTTDFEIFMYFAGARFKPVNEHLENSTLLPEENWFKTVLASNLKFFHRGNSNSYYDIKFEWMNNWDFERNFDNRSEPRTTIEMIRWIPRNVLDVKRYLNWTLVMGDRGDKHSINLTFSRTWMWNDTINPDEVNDYSIKGLYMPIYDQFPMFSFTYTNSFRLFQDKEEKKDSGLKETVTKDTGQNFNWEFRLGGNSYREYNQGELFRKLYTYNGHYYIYTVFPLFKYFTYTPGVKLGFNAQYVNDPNAETRQSSETAADKNSFQYVESLQNIKLGSLKYYFQVSHYYRRSYLEKEVIEPFIHEKVNYFQGGFYFFPVDGIDMSVTSSYDARRKYPFEDERWRDVEVKNNFFFDFYNFLKGDSLKSKNKGLFYSGVALVNKYKYIVRDQTSGYNDFDISFSTGNFSLLGLKRVRNIEVGYNWFHDFRFPFRDMMSIRWNIDAEISRRWRVDLGGDSQADRSYLYYDGENGLSPFDDIRKSAYFYDKEKSKGAVFILRNFHFDILHDIHCWEVGFSYQLERTFERIGPDNRDRLIYYDQRFFITLRMRSFTEFGVTGAQVYGSGKEAQY